MSDHQSQRSFNHCVVLRGVIEHPSSVFWDTVPTCVHAFVCCPACPLSTFQYLYVLKLVPNEGGSPWCHFQWLLWHHHSPNPPPTQEKLWCHCHRVPASVSVSMFVKQIDVCLYEEFSPLTTKTCFNVVCLSDLAVANHLHVAVWRVVVCHIGRSGRCWEWL